VGEVQPAVPPSQARVGAVPATRAVGKFAADAETLSSSFTRGSTTMASSSFRRSGLSPAPVAVAAPGSTDAALSALPPAMSLDVMPAAERNMATQHTSSSLGSCGTDPGSCASLHGVKITGTVAAPTRWISKTSWEAAPATPLSAAASANPAVARFEQQQAMRNLRFRRSASQSTSPTNSSVHRGRVGSVRSMRQHAKRRPELLRSRTVADDRDHQRCEELRGRFTRSCDPDGEVDRDSGGDVDDRDSGGDHLVSTSFLVVDAEMSTFASPNGRLRIDFAHQPSLVHQMRRSQSTNTPRARQLTRGSGGGGGSTDNVVFQRRYAVTSGSPSGELARSRPHPLPQHHAPQPEVEDSWADIGPRAFGAGDTTVQLSPPPTQTQLQMQMQMQAGALPPATARAAGPILSTHRAHSLDFQVGQGDLEPAPGPGPAPPLTTSTSTPARATTAARFRLPSRSGSRSQFSRSGSGTLVHTPPSSDLHAPRFVSTDSSVGGVVPTIAAVAARASSTARAATSASSRASSRASARASARASVQASPASRASRVAAGTETAADALQQHSCRTLVHFSDELAPESDTDGVSDVSSRHTTDPESPFRASASASSGRPSLQTSFGRSSSSVLARGMSAVSPLYHRHTSRRLSVFSQDESVTVGTARATPGPAHMGVVVNDDDVARRVSTAGAPVMDRGGGSGVAASLSAGLAAVAVPLSGTRPRLMTSTSLGLPVEALLQQMGDGVAGTRTPLHMRHPHVISHSADSSVSWHSSLFDGSDRSHRDEGMVGVTEEAGAVSSDDDVVFGGGGGVMHDAVDAAAPHRSLRRVPTDPSMDPYEGLCADTVPQTPYQWFS